MEKAINKQWELICIGLNNPDFNFDDLELIQKIKRLAEKYQSLGVMDCNGKGYIKGNHYHTALSYGQKGESYYLGCVSAYIVSDNEKTIFDIESEKIFDKINNLVATRPAFSVKFQGDCRGAMVRLFYNKNDVTNLL